MIVLTDEQERVVEDAVAFYKNDSQQVFEYTGPAGTGKTVVMRAIIDRLGLEMEDVAPMTYVGAAAIVLRTKGLINAKTIHSWLFTPVLVPDMNRIDSYTGKPYMKLQFVPKDLSGKKLICIDEAGAVPLSLKKEIESRGIKIIACGDLNQLPPVVGEPAYLYGRNVHHLTHIMRQAEGSGIVYLANQIIKGHYPEPGMYGDVLVIPSSQLSDNMLLNSRIIICGRNYTRDRLNRRMRKLYGIDPYCKLPIHGEKLICRKNNWKIGSDDINLANGLSGYVTNYPSVTDLQDNKDLFTIDFYIDSLGITFRDLRCNFRYFNASDAKERDLIKKNRFSKGEDFELGYAITTHVSQGSQFTNGVYISEFMGSDEFMKHLDYTGITRFSDTCIFVTNRSYKTF